MSAATNTRSFRTFLLVSQLQAQEIGARIALARNESGLTQEQLADLGSFSKRSLQNWEAGVVIPYKSFEEISRLLRRPTDWFLHGELSEPDDEQPRLELRLAELADAIELLRRQFQEATLAVTTRLERIEALLPSRSASGLPRARGRRATGTGAA